MKFANPVAIFCAMFLAADVMASAADAQAVTFGREKLGATTGAPRTPITPTTPTVPAGPSLETQISDLRVELAQLKERVAALEKQANLTSGRPAPADRSAAPNPVAYAPAPPPPSAAPNYMPSFRNEGAYVARYTFSYQANQSVGGQMLPVPKVESATVMTGGQVNLQAPADAKNVTLRVEVVGMSANKGLLFERPVSPGKSCLRSAGSLLSASFDTSGCKAS